MEGEPSDGRRFLLIALGALWLMAFIYAFVAYTMASIEADQIGGFNGPALFLGWQGIAGLTAVAIYGVGLGWDKTSAVRRLSRLPVTLAFLQVFAIIAIMVWSNAT